MDRASALDDDEALDLIRKHFVAAAINLTEAVKSQDAEGDFFRKIVEQRAEPKHTRQGFYVAAPDGTLIEGWMYPRPDKGAAKLKEVLKRVMQTYKPPRKIDPLDATKVDRQCNPRLPDGAAVVDAFAKLTAAEWGPSAAERVEMIRGSVGRDRLWILQEEIAALGRAEFPDSLLERVIRFHLLDNTRGVPERWKQDDIKAVEIKLTREKSALRVQGLVQLAEPDNRRFDVRLFGCIEMKAGALSRFDFVARGKHSAKKTDVGEVPIGDATLAIAFSLAAPGAPPLYTWDLPDYLRNRNLKVTQLRAGK